MLCEHPRYFYRKYGKLEPIPIDEYKLIKKGMYTYLEDEFGRRKRIRKRKRRCEQLVTVPVIKLPCVYCRACRRSQCAEWTLRCCLEAKEYENNMFITLTYDEDHLPELGVEKKDLQRFIHNLREHFSRKHKHTGIRYFGCGEYGEDTLRPHYHLIVFNCPKFGDEIFYKKNKQRQNLYTSKILDHLWGKGNCVIGSVTRQSISYVTSFRLKSYYSRKVLPEDYNLIFYLVSNRKGIGYDYLNRNLEQIVKDDKIQLTGSLSYKLPKYFNKKIKEKISDERYKKELEEPRAARAKANLADEMARTGLTEDEIIAKRTAEEIKKIDAVFMKDDNKDDNDNNVSKDDEDDEDDE